MKNIVYLIIIFVFFLTLPLAAREQNIKPKVGILLMQNRSGETGYDGLCNTMTETMELSLRCLDIYDIERVIGIDPYGEYEESIRKFKLKRIDYAIYGKIFKDESETLLIEINIYDRAEDAVIIEESKIIESLFYIFDAAD